MEESLVTVKTSTHVLPLVKNLTLSISIRITISKTIMEAPSIEFTTIQTSSRWIQIHETRTLKILIIKQTKNQNKRTQNFNNNKNSNPRLQNHTSSNNQINFWIQPQVQRQAIPVIFYTEGISIETFSFVQREWQKTQNKLNGETTRKNKHRSHFSSNFFTLRSTYNNINRSFSWNWITEQRPTSFQSNWVNRISI